MTSMATISWPSMAKKMCLRSNSQRRQSFDRFGDDLSQLLLSYLRFDDKITLECVCKQWQRLIPLTVDEILFTIKFCQITDDSLAKLLSKCPNIRRIELKFIAFTEDYFPILSFVIRYCHQLRDIYLNICFGDYKLVSLVGGLITVYAKQLQTIKVGFHHFRRIDNAVIRHLQKCTNLLAFNCRTDTNVGRKTVPKIYRQLTYEPLFKRLEKLEINVFDKKMVDIFNDIVRLYRRQLISLFVEIDCTVIDADFMSTIIAGLSLMTKLSDLTIEMYNKQVDAYRQQLAQLLPSIAHRCHRLKSLKISLEIDETDDENCGNLLNAICHNFKQLNRLNLDVIDLIGSDNHQMMNGFKQLTHLSILSKPMSTTDHFIDDIVANCPRLQYLQYTGYRIDLQALKSLQRLPHLRTIDLNNVDPSFDIDLDAIYQKFRKINKITINNNN